MWDRVDGYLARAPSLAALRHHRVELLEARRRRAAGLELGEALLTEETHALADDLAAAPLLARVRAAWDGPLVLVKGPELALDYPAPRLRRFGDLDLLTDDAEGAQAALLAAGFREVFDPDDYAGIHHLRPLWWPGLPLVVELHTRPNWPDGVPAPPIGELLAESVPSRLGVDGVGTLPPAHHAVLLAAHAWSHQPLGRLGNLIDVAVALGRCDPADAAAVARRWRNERLWRTTRAAIRDVLEGGRPAAGAALWARHLRGVRERTVLEWHLHHLLGPAWVLPPARVPAAVARAASTDLRPLAGEPLSRKLRRARLAIGHAGVARSEHVLALAGQGHISTGGTEE